MVRKAVVAVVAEDRASRPKSMSEGSPSAKECCDGWSCYLPIQMETGN